MKSLRIALVAAVAIASMLAGCQKTKNADSIELKNQVDSVSYALGFFEGSGFNNMLSRTPFDSLDCKLLAQSFAESTLTDEYLNMRRNQFDTLDVNAFMHGFIHQIRFRKGMMDEQMANIVCQLKFEAVKARKQAERDTLAARNLEEGQKFLAENAAKDSVVMLESGLQYKILVAGTGARPTADSRVKVNYEGRLIDGTVFDSLRAQRTCHLQGDGRHQRLDRGSAADARRLQVGTLHPLRSGLRQSGRRRKDSAQQHAHLHRRASFDRRVTRTRTSHCAAWRTARCHCRQSLAMTVFCRAVFCFVCLK